MQIKNLADMAKAVQAVIEAYYGLAADFGQIYPPHKSFKPLCMNLGVGLFGIELTLYSPTGRPVTGFSLNWTFHLSKGGDEDEFSNWESWGQSGGISSREFDNKLPPSPDAVIRRVALEVSYRGRSGAGDLTDLRCLVRERLKQGFTDVTVKLVN